jgi:hypothetical protein
MTVPPATDEVTPFRVAVPQPALDRGSSGRAAVWGRTTVIVSAAPARRFTSIIRSRSLAGSRLSTS